MLRTLLAVSLLALPIPAADGWMSDLVPALAAAREQGKDVLVDFTGSDWCPPCKRLHAEVFSQEAFHEYASEDFVLVELDFPRGQELLDAMGEDLQARNQEFAQAFGIQYFPTVVLMTNDGVEYARTGYEQGGADAYAAHVEELRAERDAVVETLRAFRGDDDAARLQAAYELIGKTTPAFRDELVATIRELDPEDEQLLIAREVFGGFFAEHLGVAEPDFPAALEAARALPSEQASLDRFADYHLWLAVLEGIVTSPEAAESSLARAEELGATPDAIARARDLAAQTRASRENEG